MFEVRRALDLYKDKITQWQLDMALESEGMELESSVVEAGVSAVFRDMDKGHYLLAHLNGDRPVGCLLVLREWSDWRNGWLLWVHSVYVEPEFRKLGAYRALHEHLMKEVEEQESVKGIRLFADKTNHKASKVYRNLGMSDDHYNMFEWIP